MTLFHLRELWNWSALADEEFDANSLLVCNIDNSQQNDDKVITANFKGILRVFRIPLAEQTDEFGASDLLMEIDFKEPIVQITSGLLLQSHNLQLGVLHPKRFCVYSISFTSGATDHGTSYNILLIYEHTFDYSAFNVMLGCFGHVRDKELVCIQSIDAELNFFENEAHSFSFTRGNGQKFPAEMVYIPERDYMVLVDNFFTIECYRYQELMISKVSKSADQESQPNLVEWSFSFGEAVLDLATVVLLDKTVIVVLGEKSFLVLRDTGAIWFQKSLDASPRVMCCYSCESRESLITIIATDMNNLLIFQNEILKWACKLPFIPVAMRRGKFGNLKGALVLLSDEGNLSVGYLGTNPSLKIVPMPSPSVENEKSEAINEELRELKAVIASYNVDGKKKEQDDKLAMMLDVMVKQVDTVTGNILDVHFVLTSVSKQTGALKMIFFSSDFYHIEQNEFDIPEFEQEYEFKCRVEILTELPLNDRINCCVLLSRDNNQRILSKSIHLPFENLVDKMDNSGTAHVIAKLSFIAKLNETRPHLENLFEEITSNRDEMFVCFKSNPNINASVRFESNELQCIIGSTHPVGLYRIVKLMLKRIESNCKQLRLRGLQFSFSPIEQLCDSMRDRLKQRRILRERKHELENFAKHHRLVQKRILVKLKDKNPTSMANFEKILNITRIKINENIEAIQVAEDKLMHLNYQVWTNLAILKLIFANCKSKIDSNKLEQLLRVITIEQVEDFTMNWDEELELQLIKIFHFDRELENLSTVIDSNRNLDTNPDGLFKLLDRIFTLVTDKCAVNL